MKADCGTNMTTYSGKYINPDNLQPGDLCIEDIAHGLSNCCRFAGQCREFYSVGQHSALIALALRDEMRRANIHSETHILQMARIALMHDAPEAYCSDLVRCIKQLVGAAYDDVEYMIWLAVVEEFKLYPLLSLLRNGEDVSDYPKRLKSLTCVCL